MMAKTERVSPFPLAKIIVGMWLLYVHLFVVSVFYSSRSWFTFAQLVKSFMHIFFAIVALMMFFVFILGR